MSITINRIGGGGLSPSSAVIRVIAPVGSTISFSKGGVIVKVLGPEKSHVNANSPTLADWYYSVNSGNYGTWTVTATDGTSTASDTIFIATNNEYTVPLTFNVPTGYKAVVYIQSAGSQYIDSGISLGSNFKISSTIWLTQTANCENPLFSIWLSSPNYWNLFIPNNDRKFDLYASGHHYFQTLTLNEEYSYSIERSNDVWISTVDNVESVLTISMEATNTTSLKFLARGDGAGPSYWKLGQTKVYKNGELAGDFYPCYRLSDSVAGMWDKVSESFFQNAGSGSFTVGPDAN